MNNNEPQQRLSMVFYRDWHNMMKGCTPEVKLALYDAIMNYAFEGIENTDPALSMVFSLIKQRIESDADKWTSRRETNRANGCKGGRPRKENQSVIKETEKTERLQVKTEKGYNVNVNVNDNVNVFIKEKKEKFLEVVLAAQGKYTKKHLQTFAEYYGQQSSQDPSKLLYETLAQFDLEYALQQWKPKDKKAEPQPIAYDLRTPEERLQAEAKEWNEKRKELEGWIESAKQAPDSRAAKQVKAWSDNGTLAKYGLVI